MFPYPFQHLNADRRVQILTTSNPEYYAEDNSDHATSPISAKIKKELKAMHSIIDITHKFSRNGAKGLTYFTAFNVLCYHFTGWISTIALTYGITIVIFGWISYEFLKLESGLLQLKETFILMVNSEEERRNHYTLEEISGLSAEEQDSSLHDYHARPPVFRLGQTSSLKMDNRDLQIRTTLTHVQGAIRQIEHLRRSIPIISRYFFPIKIPIRNLSGNLRHIETYLNNKLRT